MLLRQTTTTTTGTVVFRGKKEEKSSRLELAAPYSEEMHQKKREYPHQIKVGNNTTDGTVNSEIKNNHITPPAEEIIEIVMIQQQRLVLLQGQLFQQ
mmetsp:Transcript_26668/g.29521  ORF Transcript_26668/g.29521 Transcript_26668/m.29521 type:complete len:97 (+) Transcript_26668:361-651(+)